MSMDTLPITLPPHDTEAEKSVLGSLLLEPARFDELALRAEEFHSSANATIFRVFAEMWHSGHQCIDAVSLANELARQQQLEVVGGPAYVAELMEVVPHSAHAAHYAKLVQKDAFCRAIIHASRRAIEVAYTGDTKAGDQLESDLQAIRDTSVGGDAVISMNAAVDALEERERTPNSILSTGLVSLDAMLTNGGFRGGQLIVIGGSSGGGKSALAGQLARHAAEDGQAALVVSLEVPRDELAERFDAVLPRDDLRRLPIWIVDSVSDAQRIGSLIRLAKRKHGIQLAVVDYIQLATSTESRTNRERQVAEVSRSLKQLAKELRIPIIACCQLNKDFQREKRPPELRDLRESSAIGHDADVVLLVHRDNNEAKLIVGKQRNGQKGAIDLAFIGPEFRFADAAHEYQFGSDQQ